MLTEKRNALIRTIREFITGDAGCQNLYNSILPQLKIEDLATELINLCRKHFASELHCIIYQYFSVGYSLGLQLENERKIFLKILNVSRENRETLEFKIGYQQFLNLQGIRTPEVLAPPLQVGSNIFIVSAFNQDGAFADTRNPEYRKLMAAELYNLNACYAGFEAKNIHHLQLITDEISERSWSKPHNALFDFTRHKSETAWLDEKMRDALVVIKEYSRHDQYLVSHADWSGKHFKFNNNRGAGPRIEVIYDWDSLMYMSLYKCLATAALTFTYNDEIGIFAFSDYNDISSFLAEYQATGKMKFTVDELMLISAYCTYIASYICKCFSTASESKDNTRLMESNQMGKNLKQAKQGLFFEIAALPGFLLA